MNTIIRPQIIGSSQPLGWLPVLRTDRDGPVDYICILGGYLLVIHEANVSDQGLFYIPYKGRWVEKDECYIIDTVEVPNNEGQVKMYSVDHAALIAYRWYEQNILVDRVLLSE